MLRRIESIQGVGLFHDAHGAAHKLEQSALVFAGNGRGKSTLGQVLRSVSSGDAGILTERTTIDGTIAPAATLQFDTGHKVTFSGTWSEVRPEFTIFDSTFIEENVFSGTEVTPDNRKNLLDFALGDRAVVARQNEDKAVRDQQAATALSGQIAKEIAAVAGQTSPVVFRNLRRPSDVDLQRKNLEKRKADAARAVSILAQPVPAKFELVDLQLDEVFRVLATTLDDVHFEAEQIVTRHISSLPGANAADWVSEGLSHDDGIVCPYCGQSTIDLPLIHMYQLHFNEAYARLKAQIASAIETVESATRPEVVKRLIEMRNKTNEWLTVWSADVDVAELSSELDNLAEATLANLREYLLGQLSKKLLAPGEDLGGVEARDEADRLWNQFAGIFEDENELIDVYVEKIEEFKRTVRSEDLGKLDASIAELDLIEVRFSDRVIEMFERLASAEKQLKDAETDKGTTRGQLTAVMTSTLDQYRVDINRYLANLGAAFTIDEIKTNYFGSAPRSDYGLVVRGKKVKLAGGTPSFSTVLSEGDKRTLAFAFFVASTLRDPNIASRIVVVDDPVSSLDRSRREATTELLVQIASQCGQLILLAHDANFLREARIALEKASSPQSLSVFQIQRIANDYSDFASIDLDRECETPYYSNYRTVDEFAAGTRADARAAATALRPLLEGYLHRRFPGKIPDHLMLGSAITEIENAVPPSPLQHLQGKVQELRDLNAFAGKFHHDTNPGYQAQPADQGSVLTYANRVLDVIHGA